MGMSNYCLQSWRDVFGEMSVGLKRLGVSDVSRVLRAKYSIYGLCSGGTLYIWFLSILTPRLGAQSKLHLNILYTA